MKLMTMPAMFRGSALSTLVALGIGTGLLGAEPRDLAYEPLVDYILDRFADHLETHLDCDRLLALSAR